MNRRLFSLTAVAFALAEMGIVEAAPAGTCPNGKDSFCDRYAEGCFCSPEKQCLRCPEGSKQTVSGGCRCQHRARVCKRIFGGKRVEPLPCGGGVGA